MNKIILLSCMFILLCVHIVNADVEWVLTNNLTDLPIQGTINYNFTLAENSTIFFDEVQSSKANFTFPANIWLDNTTNAELEINYTFPFFSGYSGNQTLDETVIEVSNNLNSNMVLLKFLFTTLHDPLSVEGNITPHLVLEDSGKLVQVYTVSGVNFNQLHTITVKANQTSIVNINCGDFLTCPSNVTVPDNYDSVSFDVNINISDETIPATYLSYVNVSAGNSTGEINFEIIVSGDVLYNTIRYQVWDESCYDSPERLAECYKEQSKYSADVANAMYEELKAGNYTTTTEVQVNETIKYVEVGNVDPELFKDNKNLREKYNTLANEQTSCASKLDICVIEKGKLQTQVAIETEELSSSYILKRSKLEQESNASKGKTLSWVFGGLFFVLLFVLLIGLYMQNNWMVQQFPSKIVGSLSSVMLICWILTGVLL